MYILGKYIMCICICACTYMYMKSMVGGGYTLGCVHYSNLPSAHYPGCCYHTNQHVNVYRAWCGGRVDCVGKHVEMCLYVLQLAY